MSPDNCKPSEVGWDWDCSMTPADPCCIAGDWYNGIVPADSNPSVAAAGNWDNGMVPAAVESKPSGVAAGDWDTSTVPADSKPSGFAASVYREHLIPSAVVWESQGLMYSVGGRS